MARYATDLGIDDYIVFQDTDDYAFSQDSVFLANMAKLTPSDSVLDLGCGSGILATLALVKKHVKKAVGIELQSRVADMARDSVLQNGLQDKFEVICADVKDIRSVIKAESFDKVLCNPPYFANARTTQNNFAICAQNDNSSGGDNSPALPNGDTQSTDSICGKPRIDKNVSRTESTATLDDFVKGAAYSLRFGGDLWIVVKADRLASLVYSLKSCNLEPKEATLVYPKPTSDADIVIVKARKGGKEGLTISSFYVLDDKGEYTDKYKEMYV